MRPIVKEILYGAIVIVIIFASIFIGAYLTDLPIMEKKVGSRECVKIIGGPGYTCANYPKETFNYDTRWVK